jgi:predicted nuclease of predicted toxin-antitoxin system
VRILLDECVPARVRDAFPGHAVKTVPETGWRSSKDEPLLIYAEKNFDVFLTVDKNIARQNTLDRYRLGVIIVRLRDNTIDSFRPVFKELLEAVGRVRAGTVIYVPGGSSA